MSDVDGIIWLVVLLAFNAFFVGAEFAVIAARRSQVEPLAESGSWAAKIALKAMERASFMLALKAANTQTRWTCCRSCGACLLPSCQAS